VSSARPDRAEISTVGQGGDLDGFRRRAGQGEIVRRLQVQADAVGRDAELAGQCRLVTGARQAAGSDQLAGRGPVGAYRQDPGSVMQIEPQAGDNVALAVDPGRGGHGPRHADTGKIHGGFDRPDLYRRRLAAARGQVQ
jgi:hypothetical protein